MFKKLKQSWQEFKGSEPGHRFQDRYDRRQRESNGSFDAGKIVNILVGVVVAALGVFLVPLPGPGFLVVALGLGLIGCEFEPVAHFLDGAEVRLRKLKQNVLEFWKRLSIPVKVVVISIALGFALAAGYWIYQMFFAR